MSGVELKSSVLEKDPVGSKVLERNVFVSNSEIKAEKEQPDHEAVETRFDCIGFGPLTARKGDFIVKER